MGPSTRALQWVAACVAAGLVGCASVPPPAAVPSGGPPVSARPGPAPAGERDGPGENPPPDLAAVPDAVPRVEPLRAGGPNKPYEVLGQSYIPLAGDVAYSETGLASWYGRKFHGRRTASGEVYDMYAMTAAHPTLPLPSYARVRNPANGREVVVRVNDRGPFHAGRIIDLSYAAALRLGVQRGVAKVQVERLVHDDIRSGAWRRQATDPDIAVAAAAPAPSLETGPLPVQVLAPAPMPVPMPLPGVVAPVVASTEPVVVASAGTTVDDPIAAIAAQPDPPLSMAPAALEPARTAAARGFWLQLGAFSRQAGALDFRQRVADSVQALAPLLAVFSDSRTHRLQAGPFGTREQAHEAAEQVRLQLQLVPLIVERR